MPVRMKLCQSKQDDLLVSVSLKIRQWDMMKQNNNKDQRKASLCHCLGLSVKISRCRHLQKIIVNWWVSLLSLLRQQSLLFIDYICFNKSKSYARDMQARLKERKIILENFAAPRKERKPKQITTNQRLKLKRCVAFAHIISRNILIRALLKQRFSKV